MNFVNLMTQEPVNSDHISMFKKRLDKFMDSRSVNDTEVIYLLTFLIHVHAWGMLGNELQKVLLFLVN